MCYCGTGLVNARSHPSEYSIVSPGNGPTFLDVSLPPWFSKCEATPAGWIFLSVKLCLKTEHHSCCPVLRVLHYCDQNELEMQLITALRGAGAICEQVT